MSDNPVDREILRNKKDKFRRKYIIRQSLDGKIWYFINKKTHKLVRTLRFVRLPDIYYDNYRKKEVNSDTSAFVLLIMDRMYRRSEIVITEWKGFKKCKNKKCRKCLTREVAIPRNGKFLLKYNIEYVFEHLSRFEFKIKCKLFDPENPNKYEYLWIPIEHIKEKNVYHRNVWIQHILESGIPIWVVQELFKLSRAQVYNIRNLKKKKK